jgi:hypothetical protein
MPLISETRAEFKKVKRLPSSLLRGGAESSLNTALHQERREWDSEM